MIKELILSLAIAAASGVHFLDSPKKSHYELSDVNGNYSATISNTSYDVYFPGNLHFTGTPVLGDSVIRADRQEQPNYGFYYGLSSDGQEATFEFRIFFNSLGLADDFQAGDYLTSIETNGDYDGTYTDDDGYNEYWAAVTFIFDDLDEGNMSFSVYVQPSSFTITTDLTNCVILSVPTLPQTFTANEVGNHYVIQAAANSGGYGLTSSSLSVTGAQVSNLTYNQEQGNTGYYNGLNFTLTLQAANCTISITAYLPTYTLTSELNNCSVSPSLPSTFNYGLVQTYTFTANSGYAFNNVVTQWDITGANIGEITYSSLLYGDLYSQVSIELGFIGGNASVKVTAAQYDINSYQQGYDNGYTNGDTAGYNRGYSQGLTAGNSYGVWNWLKQAALTTGEFLSVPLLPGFSIGALLTAIAGLVIIWLFIKGFLFKS